MAALVRSNAPNYGKVFTPFDTWGIFSPMRASACRGVICATLLVAEMARAGGSGLNVIVAVNQSSSNSVQLGNEYCEKRGVPPQNLFRISGWTGGGTNWSRTDFERYLRQPLLGMLSSRGLTNQAQFILLSMDIPYRVLDTGGQNSTTSALFYGFKYDGTNSPAPGFPGCSLPDSSSNSYAFSEMAFADAPPNTADTNSFLAMMLTETTLAGAELPLNSGVASDGTFPTQTVFLAKTSDSARNVRFVEFDNAIFDARLRKDNALVWLSGDSVPSTNLLGLATGLGNFYLPPATFIPGAFGDSLTSYGGALFDNTGQTLLLAFLEVGAAGSYGTVVEPCNYTQKFPHPLDYFYQNRGFSLAEAYYQSVLNPYQGLLVGEPLSAPFARPGIANWSSLTNNAVLTGLTPLSLTFSSAATNVPLDRAELFVDGTFAQTLTNLPPAPGNKLSVTVNGFMANYTVPANATVASSVTGLAGAVNALSNSTQVQAFPVGDRLELQSLEVSVPSSNVTVSASASQGTASSLTTLLAAAQPTFLDTIATGRLDLLVSNSPVVGDWLKLDFVLTNGSLISVAVTNSSTNATIGALTQSLGSLVNAQPALQSADGVVASDFLDVGTEAQFSLYPRSAGWAAAEIQATLTTSTDMLFQPSGPNKLEVNLTDLRPRNHLYVCAGVTNLPVNFIFNSGQFADGYHQLTVVAYEGTSVRTQTRVSRTVVIKNTALSATLTTTLAGTNATPDFPLQFTVSANEPSILETQLFSTGGAVVTVSNQQTAVFLAPSAMLGVGLHPFYAVVTDTSGHQYQTQTLWVRIVPSIALSISTAPLLLSWPAYPGLTYNVLATTNLLSPFQRVASVTAPSSAAQWPVTAPGGAAAFYRVGLSP